MPFVSQAQRRYFHWASNKGIISPATTEHWEEATPKGEKLPERIHPKKKKKKKDHVKRAFVDGFEKVAVVDLAAEANIASTADAQTAIWGSDLRRNASTAQAKGRATRTLNVQDENREFNPGLYHKWRNSRVP